ncbi:hypothetical protein SBD_5294 [Streptomyces bottropensis ATCC 25435]|uniref:Uncharacterized protein n=1 Tax=Streptomyces bottropensis ATCC 25435 TaxID=1054862 RepID=M3EC41_9ACTN|nr:hypothetical protein SBD_5294 [Streptomyces bottropensis ATCC 25435]
MTTEGNAAGARRARNRRVACGCGWCRADERTRPVPSPGRAHARGNG